MALLVEDEQTIRELEHLAAQAGISPGQALKSAVHEKFERTNPVNRKRSSQEAFDHALRLLQDEYQKHLDPNDKRTADEIIGYNDLGHFN